MWPLQLSKQKSFAFNKFHLVLICLFEPKGGSLLQNILSDRVIICALKGYILEKNILNIG